MISLTDRIRNDPVGVVLDALYCIARAGFVLFLLAILLLSTGCASTRYLTAEEDAKMREVCGENKSCTVLHNSEWEAVERMLHRCIGI